MPSRDLGLLAGLPVLIGWGSQDKTIPPVTTRTSPAGCPTPHLVEITGAGPPARDRPARLLRALHTFLRATAPFHYDETRWRHLLTQPPP